MDELDALSLAYEERNRLVAALARLFPSGIRKTDIPDWDPVWHNCVFIDLPTGQVSWHFHDRELPLFVGLPGYTKPWDGHSTSEKYERLARLGGHIWLEAQPQPVIQGVDYGYAEPLPVGFVYQPPPPAEPVLAGWLPLDGDQHIASLYPELSSMFYIDENGYFTLPNMPGHWIKAKP